MWDEACPNGRIISGDIKAVAPTVDMLLSRRPRAGTRPSSTPVRAVLPAPMAESRRAAMLVVVDGSPLKGAGPRLPLPRPARTCEGRGACSELPLLAASLSSADMGVLPDSGVL